MNRYTAQLYLKAIKTKLLSFYVKTSVTVQLTN